MPLRTLSSSEDPKALAMHPNSDDPIETYTRDQQRSRRRGLRRAALVMFLAAAAATALASRMSDIGHAVGFVGLGVSLLAGAVYIWVQRT